MARNDRARRRCLGVRSKLKKRAPSDRKRLSVFRSSKHIYAQIIDDVNGLTLVSACPLDVALRSELKNGANIYAARAVGRLIAERAVVLGISKVFFDRGPYLYHGRIKALADAAREAGLDF